MIYFWFVVLIIFVLKVCFMSGLLKTTEKRTLDEKLGSKIYQNSDQEWQVFPNTENYYEETFIFYEVGRVAILTTQYCLIYML